MEKEPRPPKNGEAHAVPSEERADFCMLCFPGPSISCFVLLTPFFSHGSWHCFLSLSKGKGVKMQRDQWEDGSD